MKVEFEPLSLLNGKCLTHFIIAAWLAANHAELLNNNFKMRPVLWLIYFPRFLQNKGYISIFHHINDSSFPLSM